MLLASKSPLIDNIVQAVGVMTYSSIWCSREGSKPNASNRTRVAGIFQELVEWKSYRSDCDGLRGTDLPLAGHAKRVKEPVVLFRALGKP